MHGEEKEAWMPLYMSCEMNIKEIVSDGNS